MIRNEEHLVSKLEVIEETTKGGDYPNHTYVLASGRLVAYIKDGTGVLQKLRPMYFSKKGRTFNKVKGSALKSILAQF